MRASRVCTGLAANRIQGWRLAGVRKNNYNRLNTSWPDSASWMDYKAGRSSVDRGLKDEKYSLVAMVVGEVV